MPRRGLTGGVVSWGELSPQSDHTRPKPTARPVHPLPTQRSCRSLALTRGDRLRDCAAPAGKRFRDNSIDMGTGYDCFDPLAHPFNARIRGKQRCNRLALREPMIRAGFKGLATEWWHFTLRDEPYPDTFFDFPMERASLR